MTEHSSIRLVYFGSGDFGLPTLQSIVQHHDVALVVSQPDRPAGRKRRLTPTAISQFALESGIDLYRPEKPNEPEAIQRVHEINADAYVVIAYGHKLLSELLGNTFAINVHGSLLPKYRGAAPINWAVINGEKETGISIITLSQTMDGGEILATRTTAIDPMDTAGEVHDRLAQLAPDAVGKVLKLYREGTLQPQTQNAALVSKAPKLSKADGHVSFDQPAPSVRCRIHGLTPWPGCTIHADDMALKLHRVKDVSPADLPDADFLKNAQPGELLRVAGNGYVACESGTGAIQLLEVQPSGGRIMSFDDYLRGHPFPAGSRCQSP